MSKTVASITKKATPKRKRSAVRVALGRAGSMTFERAATIANDVSENIDCKETRKELREAISVWSLKHCEKSMELANAKGEIVIGKLAVQLLLRLTRRNKSKWADQAREVAQLFLSSNNSGQTAGDKNDEHK